MNREASTRRFRRSVGAAHLGWLGLAYLVFVVYGSLVPLDYVAMPLDQAIERFRAVPFLDLGIGSRADWVANLLLFIPLTFFWTGVLVYGRSMVVGVLGSLFVIAAALILSLGIEFTQLFFPQRTVSQNDILAETLGGLLGVVVWWGAGQRWVAWYQSWHHARAPSETVERLAWTYVAITVVYGVLPLDLTISGVELFHKWQEGKLSLIPFGRLPEDPGYALYELASDALLWLPPALLWRMRPGISGLKAWQKTCAIVLVLEVLQLFVYSRVSDVTDLLTGALGAWLGVLLGGRWAGSASGQNAGSIQPRRSHQGINWWALAMAFAWFCILVGVFWYPFNFHTEGVFLRERLSFLDKVPFQAYYYGTEFRAVTEVLHKVLFFAPLGALLAWFVSGLTWSWRGPAAVLSMLGILAAAMVIELGQVMLPQKFPDTTDFALESLGGLMGYGLFRAIRSRLRPPASTPRQFPVAGLDLPPRTRRRGS